jgi:hypothetical protein
VCRDRRRGHRLIIAAAFAGQAAIIAVVAAGSARGTSAAVSVTAGPAFSAAPAPAGPPSPAVPPGTAPPVPAVPLPPGEIAVTVSAAGPGSASQGGASQSGASRSGASQSGDIGFPAPEDPPLLVLRPGADTAITVTLTIPPGARVRGLWLGVAADQGAGSPHVRRLLVASLNASPGHGRHAYVLHWTMPAGTPAGAGSQLVLNVRHAGGADDQAPIAELVSG